MCFSDLGLPTSHSASVNLYLYAVYWKPHFEKQVFFLIKYHQIPWEITVRKAFEIFKTHQCAKNCCTYCTSRMYCREK